MQAWFDQKSGFFTMRANPQNATCRVRLRPSARRPSGFTCTVLFTPRGCQLCAQPGQVGPHQLGPNWHPSWGLGHCFMHSAVVCDASAHVLKSCSGHRCKCGPRSPGTQTPRATPTPSPPLRPSRPPSTARSPSASPAQTAASPARCGDMLCTCITRQASREHARTCCQGPVAVHARHKVCRLTDRLPCTHFVKEWKVNRQEALL